MVRTRRDWHETNAYVDPAQDAENRAVLRRLVDTLLDRHGLSGFHAGHVAAGWSDEAMRALVADRPRGCLTHRTLRWLVRDRGVTRPGPGEIAELAGFCAAHRAANGLPVVPADVSAPKGRFARL